MKKFIKALVAIMLTIAAVCAACTKDHENDSGNNNGGNGSGNGGGNANGYDYVDLSLPSGTLWATCNVGADTPEGYGEYFAWGETSPKDIYNWSTYKYANGNSNSVGWDDLRLTKYCNRSSYGDNGFTDTLTILLPEDDAATVNWGSGWCMPTTEQWKELRDNTIIEQTTQNGVEGHLFTALNGSSLFLPAAGYRYVDELIGAGSFGVYWSSSLSITPCHAWEFIPSHCYDGLGFSNYRCHGYPARPVRSARQN